jgi:hypothetical protein
MPTREIRIANERGPREHRSPRRRSRRSLPHANHRQPGKAITSLYQLMDAAYGAEQILAYARSSGQVPIVEPVKRGDWIPLDEAQRRSFWATHFQRTDQWPAEGPFWGPDRASPGSGQGDVPFDVWHSGHNGIGIVATAMLRRPGNQSVDSQTGVTPIGPDCESVKTISNE